MKEPIISLIQKDRLFEALDEMEKYVSSENDLLIEISLLKARLESVEKEKSRGMLSFDNYEVEKSKIRFATSGLLKESESELKPIYQPQLKTSFKAMKVLGSEIFVSDLYISPSYSEYDRNSDETGEVPSLPFSATHKDIEEKIQDFISPNQSNPKILLILGYPGQGKSTLCKKICYDLLGEDKPQRTPYLIELKNLKTVDTEALIKDPLQLVLDRIKKIAIPDPITGLLLLDGLDELYMKNGLTHENIYTICDHLERSIARDHPEARIIITSRLNYVSIQQLPPNRFEVVKIDEFGLDKQKDWLAKYRELRLDCHLDESVLERYWKHKVEKSNDQSIPELLGQPLTLFMVADLNINLNQVSAKATIYQQLFEQVIQRKYAGGEVHPNLEKLNPKILRETLQAIAVEIYFSDQEYLTNAEAEGMEALQKIGGQLGISDIQVTLRNLMMSFYFEEKILENSDEQDESFALEFLHKSLQEFLVAEYIWECFKNLKAEDLEEFVHTKLAEFSRRKISDEVLRTIRELVNSYSKNKKTVENIIDLWNVFLDAEALSAKNDFFPKGVLFEDKKNVLTPIQIMENVRTIFCTIMHAIGGFFESSKFIEKQKFTALELSDFYIRKSESDIKSEQYFFCRKFDSNSVFLERKLADTGFLACHFIGVNFDKAHLVGLRFHKIIFRDCTFRGARFENISFRSSSFFNCVFDNSSFQGGIDLELAGFESCSMKRIQMDSNSNTRNCSFQNVDFEGSRLHGLSFYKGLPGGCNFQNVDLRGSRLAGEDEGISQVSLKNANLRNAKIKWAEVFDVDFSEADMTGMTIFNPEFVMVDFTGAKGLTYEMFETVRTMHEIKGLPPEIETRLRTENPDIWKEPPWYANWLAQLEKMKKHNES